MAAGRDGRFEVSCFRVRPAKVAVRPSLVGFELAGGTPEQFGALVKGDTDKWAPVIKQVGLKVD